MLIANADQLVATYSHLVEYVNGATISEHKGVVTYGSAFDGYAVSPEFKILLAWFTDCDVVFFF